MTNSADPDQLASVCKGTAYLGSAGPVSSTQNKCFHSSDVPEHDIRLLMITGTLFAILQVFFFFFFFFFKTHQQVVKWSCSNLKISTVRS